MDADEQNHDWGSLGEERGIYWKFGEMFYINQRNSQVTEWEYLWTFRKLGTRNLDGTGTLVSDFSMGFFPSQ